MLLGVCWLQHEANEQSVRWWDCGSPPGLSLPKVPKGEPLKLAEAFLMPAVAFRSVAYVAFSFSVGSVGVSNYIYFHKLELCFI